jgi:hypothetical protein
VKTIMSDFSEAHEIQSTRINELAQQVRDRYGIGDAEDGAKPAVNKVLLLEQLLVNAGLEV